MFKKILIANRGEIACRIIRTAKRMGIIAVAVHSEADRNALHVQMADEAFCIGPAPALQSYLNGEKLLQTARDSAAEAIHPGYGFLSENPEFAEACTKNDIEFIGPPAEVIKQMGVKSLAKKIIAQAGIPVIPGNSLQTDNIEPLTEAAKHLGFPLLIKADRGGGGKGIRVVESLKEFNNSLKSVQREAEGSFGDTSVILEKFLPDARHIEVQIFRDKHGNNVHLFERDCSLQRRHQKILEEAPAPDLNDKLRQDLHRIALKAAQTIGYIGAGTVEFLVDNDGNYYFLEINTRLQVEHPVTECITGLDLVEWQLLVAANMTLPCRQSEIPQTGHGVEVRLYAETPEQDFLPSTGTVVHLEFPSISKIVRVDSGIQENDTITAHYDPILAKIITWGDTRAIAFANLQKALTSTQIAGVDTNTSFLLNLITHSDLMEEKNSSHFIENHLQTLVAPPVVPDSVLALACLHQLFRNEQEQRKRVAHQADSYSPWNSCQAFRLNTPKIYETSFSLNSGNITIPMHIHGPTDITISLPGKVLRARNTQLQDKRLSTYLEYQKEDTTIIQYDNKLVIFHRGLIFKLLLMNTTLEGLQKSTSDSLLSPMPGQVIAVHLSAGTTVKKGDPILTLEAMKMEYTIAAPEGGVVTDIFYQIGDTVQEGEDLIQFKLQQSSKKIL